MTAARPRLVAPVGSPHKRGSTAVWEFRVATQGQTDRATPGEQALAAALFESALPGEADHIDAAVAARIVACVESAAAIRAPGTPIISLEAAAAERTHPGRRRLALAIVNDNMPFLVDSVSLTITAAGLGIDRLLHPIVDVRRDAQGRLVKLLGIGAGPVPEGATRESIIYIELERAGARSRAELIDALTRVLADVRAAVEDWPAMLATLSSNGLQPTALHCSGRGVICSTSGATKWPTRQASGFCAIRRSRCGTTMARRRRRRSSAS
jgi:NAD-specific glutamate dehydrogenase